MFETDRSLAALFDFDGVIMDTEAQYSVFWNEIGRMYYPEIEAFGSRIKGQTLLQIYDAYFSGDAALQRSITERLYAYERSMQYVYVSGVETFLRALRAADVRIAVVTSSNREKMEQVYRAHPEFPDLVDRVLTSEDFSASKPNPECFLLGASVFETAINRCVVFEDSFHGLTAGKAAGMKVVGVSTTNPREAIEGKCDRVIADFTAFGVDDFRAVLHETK